MTDETKRETPLDDEARRATTAARAEGDAVPPTESEASPRRGLKPRQRIAAAVVGALSVALIAVSAAFLLPAVEQPEASRAAVPEVSASTGAPASSDKGDANESEDKGEGEGDAEASDEGDASSADAGASPSSDASSAASSEGGADAAGSSDAGGASPSGSTSAPSPDPDPAPSGGGSGSTAPATVTVSVGVSSSAVGNPVSGGATATFSPGATAYDALMACGLSVNAASSQFGIYVSAIGGLAEKEHGAKSGWMYSVNGTTPGIACSGYVLQDGDNVQWFYVT